MATLLTCRGISKHYGHRDLFRDLSIGFADDEHVGFLGPNGAGKSTFLKIIAGLETADAGEVNRRRGLRVGYLPQEDRFAPDGTVESTLAAALADHPLEPHERETQVNITMSRFGFEQPDLPVGRLSGGWRKRLAIAREVIRQPDLLLLDEPTNHLDVEGIERLEELLDKAPFAFLAVSHDRYFLERVTDRVVELNSIYPEGYFSVSGDYIAFLEKRAEFLEGQQAQQVALASIVRRENAFLKSNSKAQRTKSKDRIEEAYRLQDQLSELQTRTAQTAPAGIDFESTGRKSKKLLEAKGIAKALGGKLLFKDVSLLLSPGNRVGILGLNGSGKTTLIRVLTGQLPPDTGEVIHAPNLRVVVFDQMREQLPRELALRRALAGDLDRVSFGGRDIHVTAWARRFLFRMDQLESPIGELSGGEQARVLIARLMLQPADLLILDEPTNDLDINSLDVLEESLIEFPGAVILVTHDRFMLDRVCTELLTLDGNGRTGRFGTCAQWQAARAAEARAARKGASASATAGGRAAPVSAAKSQPKPGMPQAGSKTLTASEQKELKTIEATILAAEAKVDECRRAVEDPAFAGDHVEVQKRWDALESANSRVAALYTRWELLEAKARA